MNMKKTLHFSRYAFKVMGVFTFLVGLIAFSGSAQFTNSTVPPLNGGNGSGGSTFNLTVTAPILITEIGQAFQSSSQTYEIWMSNTAISGPPNISTGNGWTMIQTGSVTGLSTGLTPVVSSLPLTTPMFLAPGVYGFFVGGASVVYTTYNSSNQAVFTDAFTSINTGPGVGYGGSAPNPTFSTRQFNGSVTYIPAASTPDNVAVSSFISPGVYCAGGSDSISLTVSNYGTNQVDSFMVVWDVNSVMDSAWFISPLDTFGGTNPTSTTITLDTLTMPAGTANISAWTKWPNGVQDTDISNDSTSGTFMPALAGTFVIDPAGTGDFLSFSDAVFALDNFGVCGPIIFEAVDTTYVEQIELTNFQGMDSTNTITFRSQSGIRENVILTHGATGTADNFVVKITDAEYYTFEDMTVWAQGATYAYGFNIAGADDITIDNCLIKSHNGTSGNGIGVRVYFSGTNSCDNFTFTNNTVDGGYYNLYYYGNSAAYSLDATIENNEFLNSYYYGVYTRYSENTLLNNNHVYSNSSTSYGYGIYCYYFEQGSITNNFVEATATHMRYGIYVAYATGDLTAFLPITNNRVYLPHPSADYGMYVNNNLFVEYAFNSVYTEGDASCRSVYVTSGNYSNFKNNNIQVGGAGYAFYYNGNGVYEMDYNNLSAPNGRVGYRGGNQMTLADWQTTTGFDMNSITVDSVYSDTTRLKVCTDSLYGMGVSLPLYMYDHEGDMRNDPPCIGADEFLPIAMFGFNSDPVLCDGDTLMLVQGYYDTVVWNTIDTSNVNFITAPGTQTVSVHDLCGSDTSTFNVVAQTLALVGDTNLCEGTNADLGTGISGGTYLWSDGSTDSTLNVSGAGTVSVQVVDAHGCSSADTAVVTQSFDVVLGDSSTFCEGSSVVLDANMTGTYVWSDGSANQTLAVTASGTYTVTVTDQNCVSSDASTVTEILDAIPSFTSSSDHFTVVFTNTSQYATSYSWDFGDGSFSTDENPIHVYPWTNQDSMLYTVTLTATNDCGDIDVINDSVRAGQLVGVTELELANMVNVYPNPNNGLFNVSVKTDGAQEMSVEVMDVRGARVFTQTYGQVSGEVNREVSLANAAKGIYLVKVTLDGETAVYRISVK